MRPITYNVGSVILLIEALDSRRVAVKHHRYFFISYARLQHTNRDVALAQSYI